MKRCECGRCDIELGIVSLFSVGRGQQRRLGGEFEQSFVVRACKCGAERMKTSQMEIVQFRLGGGMSAFLTHVRLGTSLLVGELKLDAVDFAGV